MDSCNLGSTDERGVGYEDGIARVYASSISFRVLFVRCGRTHAFTGRPIPLSFSWEPLRPAFYWTTSPLLDLYRLGSQAPPQGWGSSVQRNGGSVVGW